MWDYLKALPQYLLPHHFLSSVMYKITRIQWVAFKNIFIKIFIKLYQVDLSTAIQTNPTAYTSFNDFFTRPLQTTARPIANTAVICPVDGTISQMNRINQQTIIQAKGKNYHLKTLFADENNANTFTNGNFTTIYLAPYNYHRIHMPLKGKLCQTTYIPGRLFSVNQATANCIPNLFARNERVVALFDTELGKMAMILVGALFVGSIETVWLAQITPPHRANIQVWQHQDEDIVLEKGAEMGRFNMGSTVILLFESNKIQWQSFSIGETVIMGQALADSRH